MIDGIRWKIVSTVVIIAMAISLLSGGLHQIRFGVLVLRAGIGGIVFFFLAVGINLLMIRLYPEFFESEGNEEGEAEDLEVGGRVDIVLPSETLDSLDADEGEHFGISEVQSVHEDEETQDKDAMGNLNHFSDKFGEIEEDEGQYIPKSRDVPGGDEAPEKIAQAIQTVLKRDEKG